MSYVDVDAGRDEFGPLYCGLMRSRPVFMLLMPLRLECDLVSICSSFRDCDGPVCCNSVDMINKNASSFSENFILNSLCFTYRIAIH